MGTVTVLVLVGLALVLLGVVAVHRLRTERYGHGEHRITLYSYRGRLLRTSSSTSLRKVRSWRNRALKSRRIGNVELMYANRQRERVYLDRRAARGTHTPTDDAYEDDQRLAADLLALLDEMATSLGLEGSDA